MSKVDDIKYEDYCIVCREVDENSGKIAAYEVDVDLSESYIFQVLNLRSRLNYSLKYYLTRRENVEIVKDLLKESNSIINDTDICVRI